MTDTVASMKFYEDMVVIGTNQTYDEWLARFEEICNSFNSLLNSMRSTKPLLPERRLVVHIYTNWPFLRRVYMSIKMNHCLGKKYGQRVTLTFLAAR